MVFYTAITSPRRTRFILLVICVISGLSLSCLPSTYPSKSPNKTIEFGQGGGFSGIGHRYQLLDDGRIFHLNKEDAFHPRIPNHTSNRLFKQMGIFTHLIKEQNEPGKTYQYPKLTKGNQVHRWVRNSTNRTTLDAQLKIYHSILIN